MIIAFRDTINLIIMKSKTLITNFVMIFILYYIIITTIVIATPKQTEIGLNITKILDSFFVDSSYDKRVRPNYAGPPVEVGISMHIIGISSVSEVQMDFTADFYFRQIWIDPRLSFKPRPGITDLFVGAEVGDKIWLPDTFFANEKQASFHEATTMNTFIRISSTGEVLRSIRLTVTQSCVMDLEYFPMDRQKCTIEIESYGYSMADIMYKWAKGAASVGMADNLTLPQFKVRGHKQWQKIEYLSTGNYSRLVCEIEFVRSMGYYLIQIYIPASLIVIISWVSFWLHRNASPARVQLGVTTVLTMTTLMSSTNSALPKISYVKSIDVFLGTCFVMVFAALLEYATVGYLGKRIAMRKSRSQQLVQEHRQKCSSSSSATIDYPDSRHRSSLYPHPNAPMNPCIPRPRNISGIQEVRFRSVEAKSFPRTSVDYSVKPKTSIVPESSGESGGEVMEAGSLAPFRGSRNPNTLFGVCPSDIDKYSRVVFPVCFVCFNLMYWVIYMHISDFLTDEKDEGKE